MGSRPYWAGRPEWVYPDRQVSFGHRLSPAFKSDQPVEVDEIHENHLTAGYFGGDAHWDDFRGRWYTTVVLSDSNPVELFALL